MNCDTTDVPSTSCPQMEEFDDCRAFKDGNNDVNDNVMEESTSQLRPSRRPCQRPGASVGLRLLLMTVSLAVLLQSVCAIAGNIHDPVVRKLLYDQFGRVPQDKARMPERSEVPYYIWELYEGASSDSDSPFDIVRHYLPRGVQKTMDTDANGWKVVYNLTSSGRTPEKELVVKADFRLILANEIRDAEAFREREITEVDPVASNEAIHQINVYEIDPEFPEVRRLLDTRYLNDESLQNGVKWIDFDVTPVLNRRRNDEGDDLVELYIERISPDSNHPFVDLSQSAALITQIEHLDNTRRRKRSTRARRIRRRKPHHTYDPIPDLCHREDLTIDFHEIQWDDVIAPPQFNAYQCRGSCNQLTPTARQNYSNHALIQNLLHQVRDNLVPPPCCVPTELDGLALLFFDEHNNTVVRRYEDMIVKGCGCI
uniref:TGF_BETA_2 domain-containing protein n=1 Tax=Panagrellus redivivus TaxID=6233 RepID=A0A7E4ZR97_PANRE